MQLINGKIIAKNVEGDTVTKTVVTLGIDKDEQCFIEVRSKFLQDIVENISVGENVQMVIAFEGKLSKLGKRFNNLVASVIKKIE